MANKMSVKDLDGDYEGSLTKMAGSGKNWRKRHFVLKDTSLIYFVSSKAKRPVGQITLDVETKLIEKPPKMAASKNQKKIEGGFAVATPLRVYFMYADSADEKEGWLKKLRRVIAKFHQEGPSKDEKRDTENSYLREFLEAAKTMMQWIDKKEDITQDSSNLAKFKNHTYEVSRTLDYVCRFVIEAADVKPSLEGNKKALDEASKQILTKVSNMGSGQPLSPELVQLFTDLFGAMRSAIATVKTTVRGARME
mmetsp:Transcript_1565/g.1758  ORF Transcript_1565/g.1758 Transcript_1565/m.1758 type:complete len:252 (+) Transcript_1565:35-790(+)